MFIFILISTDGQFDPFVIAVYIHLCAFLFGERHLGRGTVYRQHIVEYERVKVVDGLITYLDVRKDSRIVRIDTLFASLGSTDLTVIVVGSYMPPLITSTCCSG